MGMIQRGTVRQYFADRGFGFVVVDARQQSYRRDDHIFVHFSQIETRPQILEVGQAVQFEIQDRADRPGQRHAIKVRPIELESPGSAPKASGF